MSELPVKVGSALKKWSEKSGRTMFVGGQLTTWKDRMGVSFPEPTEAGIPPSEVYALAVTGALPEPFDCRVSTLDDATVVAVLGEIDIATVPEIEAAFESVREITERVVVDLSEVSFLDSSGLNTLVRYQQRFAERGVLFRVVVPPHLSVVRKVLDITQLNATLGVVESVEEAL